MRRSVRISARKSILLDQDETLSEDSIVTPLKKRGDQEKEASSSTKQGRPRRKVERNIKEEGLTEVLSDNEEVLITGILLDQDENVSKGAIVTPLKKGTDQEKETSLSTKQGRSSRKVVRNIKEEGLTEVLSDNEEVLITGILLDQDENVSKGAIVTPLKKGTDQEKETSLSTKQGRSSRKVVRNIKEEGLTEVLSDNEEVLITGILLDQDENVSKGAIVTPLKKGTDQEKETSLSTKQGRSRRKVDRSIREKGVTEATSDSKEDITTGILLDQEENVSKGSIVTPMKKGTDQEKETSSSIKQGRPRRKVDRSIREKGVTEESSDNKKDPALGKFTKNDLPSLESPAEKEPTTKINENKKRGGRNVSIPSKASDYKRRTRSTSQCNNENFVATNKELESTGRKDIILNEQVKVSEPSKLPSGGLNASATQSFDIISDGKMECITNSLKEPLRVILEDCGSLVITKGRESQHGGLKTVEEVKTTNTNKDSDTNDDQHAIILEDSTTPMVPLDPIQSSNQKKPFVTKGGESQPDYKEILKEVKTANVSKDCDINNSEYTRNLSDVEKSVQIQAGTDEPHENLKPNNNDLSTLGRSSKEGFEVTTKDSLKKFEKIKILNKDKVKQGLLFSKKSSKGKSLLKLTSDAFESFPFKITKKDLLDTNLPGKFITKTKKDFVDKLEHIPLTSGEKVENVQNKKQFTLSSELDPHIDLNDLYFDIKGSKTGPVQRKASYAECEKKKDILKKSELGPAFEKQEKSQARKTATQVIKQRRKEREETAGPGWYNLPKTEMTEETKRDMQVLKMRHLLNPKRFYKRGINKFPKHFQVGTVLDGAADFYSSRIPKKARKRTMVDELLHDAEFRRRNKRKFLEIQKSKENSKRKHHKLGKKKGQKA